MKSISENSKDWRTLTSKLEELNFQYDFLKILITRYAKGFILKETNKEEQGHQSQVISALESSIEFLTDFLWLFIGGDLENEEYKNHRGDVDGKKDLLDRTLKDSLKIQYTTPELIIRKDLKEVC